MKLSKKELQEKINKLLDTIVVDRESLEGELIENKTTYYCAFLEPEELELTKAARVVITKELSNYDYIIKELVKLL